MRFFLFAILCLFLAACGGEDGKTVYVPSHDGNTTLRVLLDGYSGEATLSVQGETREVQGGEITQLGQFPEGEHFSVALLDWSSRFYCSDEPQSGVLVDPYHTVVFYCSLSPEVLKPRITEWSYSPTAPLEERWEFTVKSDSASSRHPVTGYRIEPVSVPDGGGFVHLTPDSVEDRQALRFQGYGEYKLAVYAYSDAEESSPITLTVMVENTPPTTRWIRLLPEDIDTVTAVRVDESIQDDYLPAVDVSYEWRVNDVVVEGVTGDQLTNDAYQKGDEVKVFVILDDGAYRVVEGPETVVVKDAKPTIDLSGLPGTISRGTPMDIPLSASDPDGEPVNISLAYGPRGMTVNAGRLQWDADPILFSGKGDFFLGIALNGDTANVTGHDFEVVEDVARSFVVSGNEVTPEAVTARRMADVDGDGAFELLAMGGGSNAGVFQLMELGSSITSEKGFALFSDISSSRHAKSILMPDPAGGSARAATYHSGHIHIIDFGKNRVVTRIPFTAGSELSLLYISDNGSGADLLVAQSGGSYSSRRLYAFDPDTGEEIWNSISAAMGSADKWGNVDTDPAPEIITSRGYVFDASSGMNEWVIPTEDRAGPLRLLHSSASGYDLLVRKIGENGEFSIIDAGLREISRATVPDDVYYLDTLTGNFDGDADDELAIMDFPDIYIYDIAATGFSLHKSFSSNSNRVPVRALDINGDGVEEMIAAGLNEVLVLDLVPASPEWASRPLTSCRRLSSYYPAGAVSVGGQGEYHFASGCYSGISSLRLRAQGQGITEMKIQSANSPMSALVQNLDGDSVPELITGQYQLSSVYNAETGDEVWNLPMDSGPQALRTVDANQDGALDILMANGSYVDLVDYYNQRILAQTPYPTSGSYDSDRKVHSIEVAPLTGTAETHLVTATPSGVRTFVIGDSALTLLAEVELDSVEGMTVIDVEGDGRREIVVSHEVNSEPGLSVFSADLAKHYTVSTERKFFQLISATPEGDAVGNIIALAAASDSSRIMEIHVPTGKTVWKGPYLFGEQYGYSYNNAIFGDKLRWANVDGVPHLGWGSAVAGAMAW